ncbi:hypothetical protein HAX54_038835 [Datura stramonium]|uniref:HECT-type E3 ubiquitin transferase n=1 Tax=Datura stramonium TaxID=4076 RepID=A0ABS8VMP6_DATST|nr:hypothetical protein [Datura stramonium]
MAKPRSLPKIWEVWIFGRSFHRVTNIVVLYSSSRSRTSVCNRVDYSISKHFIGIRLLSYTDLGLLIDLPDRRYIGELIHGSEGVLGLYGNSSRKRAEATSSAPSSSSSGPTTRAAKRGSLYLRRLPLLSTANSTPAAATAPISTRSRITTRSQDSLASSTPMDSTNESSGSASRTRRGKNPSHGLDKDNLDKGKEKEHEVRVRDRDRDVERSLGLNIDSGGGEDDDNDSEGGVGFCTNLTSASSAFQGLLRKLGAGLDDLLPSSAMGSASSSHQSGRLKKILAGLRADGEEGKQVEALTQLCEMLSLNRRLPVHIFCGLICTARLLTIEYMDLAEQSLQALEEDISEHLTACLRAGAIRWLCFLISISFSTGVQRVALATAANMCKKLPSDASDFVMRSCSSLTHFLQYHDAKVLEHASICLTRIVEAFASYPVEYSRIFYQVLVSWATVSVSPALSKPPEQIFEIVNLANELLPPLPQGTISLPIGTNLLIKGSSMKKSSASGSTKQEETIHPQEVSIIIHCKLLPPSYNCDGGDLQDETLSFFSQSLNNVTNISSFLAGVLAWKDPQVLVPALQVAEILMESFPGIFAKMFVREGVVHAVDALILSTSHGSATSQPSSAEKENDCIPGSSCF